MAKITKKHTNKKPSTNYKKFILPTVVGILVIATLANGLFAAYLFKRSQVHDNTLLGQMISRAVANLSRPIPTDAMSGKPYVHEAGVMFDKTPESLGELAYSYSGSLDSQPAELHLLSLSDVRMAERPFYVEQQNAERMLEAVPKFQSCARGVTISFAEQSNLKPVDTKVLSDGKTVYFYTEPLCSNGALLSYAKTINNY